jgi:hypothetical protein
MTEDNWAHREFTVTGRIYSPNESVAKHRVYWAIANSEYQEDFLIDEITIENGGTK